MGIILEANADWWTMDTCHMTVADVQVGLGQLHGQCSSARLYWITP